MDFQDKQILDLLAENSRLTNKEIGERIHMTGQAVGNRIIRLMEEGTLEKFTIKVRYETKQFIYLYMDTNQFAALEEAVHAFPDIEGFYKVTGQACYMVVSHFAPAELNRFIEVISEWARYKVETVASDRSKRDSNL